LVALFSAIAIQFPSEVKQVALSLNLGFFIMDSEESTREKMDAFI
jgi:hypothetical protein